MPSTPKALKDLRIPECYTKIGLMEKFLLHDSGVDKEDRFLIFSTEKNLKTLQNCSSWYCDGTFSVAPLIFTQMYSIHCEFQSEIMPMVYVLMSKMKKENYVEVFEALNNLNPNLSPTSIMSDFEKAAISAFADIYPLAELRGCFFHFSQCLWRKFSKIPEGLNFYKMDPNFTLHLKCLPALAFVPVSEVPDAYEKLVASSFYSQNEFLAPLLQYFEETWVGKQTEKGRRQPAYNLQ